MSVNTMARIMTTRVGDFAQISPAAMGGDFSRLIGSQRRKGRIENPDQSDGLQLAGHF